MSTILYFLVVVMVMGVAPNAYALDFDPASSFSLPDTTPVDALVTDIDSDGDSDIVFSMSGAGGGDASIRILVGDGAGGFIDTQIATGFGPQATAAGDFDSDGNVDLAVTSPSDAAVYIYRGTGNNNFVQHQIISIPTSTPDSIGVGDFDQDGVLDLAIGTQGGTPFGVYFALGNGNATFANPVGIVGSENLAALDLIIADLNGDLKFDIASPSSVFLNTGGAFTQVQALTGGQNIDQGDLDNDGDQDLIIASSSIVFTYLNDSNGNFTIQPIKNLAPIAIRDIKIADMDRDGNPDLLLTDKTGNSVEFFPGLGNGALGGALSFAVGVDPSPLAIGDWNQDNNLDFVTGNDDSNAPDASIRLQTLPNPSPGNIAPVATQLHLSTQEDTQLAFKLAARDTDKDALTYAVLTQPTGGTLTGLAPDLTYQPNLGFSGTDTFTFNANDGSADSNIATVSITVIPINGTPVAIAQSVSTNEDLALPITLAATDLDGDPLIYSIVVPPTHGGLTGTPPNVSYQPSANFNGSDSFSFKANDGIADSLPAIVSITVNGLNDAPTANNRQVITDENLAVVFVISGNDVDGDALTFVVSNPTSGTLSGIAPNLTYTPNAGFSGSDSLTFVVNDGQIDSTSATVTFTVNAVNDAPVASNQSITGDEDTSFPVTLSATDVDSNSLNYTIVTAPTNGTLSGLAPNLSYTPNNDYNGADSFTFMANDGLLNSNLATVSITVNNVNDAPVASSQSVSGSEDANISVTLSATDVDIDNLTYNIVTAPAHGTLSGVAPNLSYTPNGNYNGADSFTFVANDGFLDSVLATVSITVNNINDAPVASSKSVSGGEDSPISLILSATDVDGDALTYNIVNGPSNGVLSGVAPSLVYTPNNNFSGADSFTFVAKDGVLNSTQATVSITINNVNDAPVASNQSVSGSEDAIISVILSATDIEGDNLTYSVITAPANGTLSGVAPNLSYTPNNDFSGADSFTFKANDGALDSTLATVSITVNNVNDAPVASNQSVSGNENTTISTTLSATDIDSNILTYNVVTAPTNGTLSGVAPSLIYTPNINFNGSDSFTFMANDGLLDSNLATVSITVSNVNNAPVASSQSVSGNEDTTISVTLAATDADNNDLTYSIVTAPANGALSGVAPNLIYTPNNNYNGTDSFTFVVNDGLLNSALATVSITVLSVNDAPLSNAGPDQTTTVGTTITLNGSSSSDVDGDLIGYFWQPVSRPAGSNLVLFNVGTVSPSVLIDVEGTYVFRLFVSDGVILNTDDVVITTTAINAAPVANAGPDQTATVGSTVILDGSASSDVDGDTLGYFWQPISKPAGSNSSILGVGTVSPSILIDLPGTYTFRLFVSDGASLSTDDVVITTSAVNTIPVADAGVDQSGFVSDIMTLDGSGSSDSDGDNLTFAWSLITVPAGSTTAAIDFLDAIMPTFSPDVAGIYVAQLIVNDGVIDSLADTATINIDMSNTPPNANAGLDQSGIVSDLITLDGSGSTDADGDILDYTWSFTSLPAGSTATLSNTISVNPTFTADVEGAFVLQLTVSDGQVSSVDTVMINIGVGNTAPVADAGPDQSVVEGDLVSLDGTASSDADGDLLSYSWTITDPLGNSTTVLTGDTTATPSFIADYAGSYLAQLIVNDGQINSVADSVLINSSVPNTIPVANAGVDQSVLTGELVTLDSSSSSDADGDPLSYTWSIISAPASSTAALSNTAAASPSLIPDLAGNYIIQLIVNDGRANSLADTVTIFVSDNNPPTLALSFSVSKWDSGDGKLLLKGNGGQNQKQYEITYTSTGDHIASFVAKGGSGKFDLEIGLSVAPCSIRITETIGSEFMDQAITNASANCE